MDDIEALIHPDLSVIWKALGIMGARAVCGRGNLREEIKLYFHGLGGFIAATCQVRKLLWQKR